MDKIYKNYTEQELVDLQKKLGKKRLSIILPSIVAFFVLTAYFQGGKNEALTILLFILILTPIIAVMCIWAMKIMINEPDGRAIMCNSAINYLEKQERKRIKKEQ